MIRHQPGQSLGAFNEAHNKNESFRQFACIAGPQKQLACLVYCLLPYICFQETAFTWLSSSQAVF